jgi:hypothetical protein
VLESQEWNGPAGDNNSSSSKVIFDSCFSHRNDIKHLSSLLRDHLIST